MTRLEQLEPTIRYQMERWQVPGISVGLLWGEEAELAGYGVGSLTTGQPVTPSMLFQIGSISKLFTTTLVMSLVDAGALDLDRPVNQYLPEWRLSDATATESITLRHLLTHTGGFYGDRFDDHGDGDNALARAVAAMADLPQETLVGELWTYCNAGFDLAGRVVESVMEMPFERAMRERVFVPLELLSATYFASEAIRHPVAVGHAPDDAGGWKVADPWPIPRRSGPAGGISCRAEELLQFTRMHLDGGRCDGFRVLSAGSVAAMQTVQTTADYGRDWGLGWQIRRIGETMAIEHNGATNGFTSRLTVVPESRFAVAVLTNGDFGAAAHTAIAKEALAMYLGLETPLPPAITADDAALNRFCGRFRHEQADIEINRDGNNLLFCRTTHEPFSNETTVWPPAPAVPISPTVFRIEEGELKEGYGEVILNADGGVRFLRFRGRLAHPLGG